MSLGRSRPGLKWNQVLINSAMLVAEPSGREEISPRPRAKFYTPRAPKQNGRFTQPPKGDLSPLKLCLRRGVGA